MVEAPDNTPTPTRRRGPLLASVAVAVALTVTSSASAFEVISTAGEGAGQTDLPNGLTMNYDTGRLYVADRGNNRVSVFGPTGDFEKAFGWGVKTGGNQFEVCTTACRAGLKGEGSGQFDSATFIAVDPNDGSVYVADRFNQRVEKFTEEGDFLLTFGGGVNKTKVSGGAPKAERDVCPVDPGDICGAGSDGFGEGEFSASASLTQIFVGVAADGTVYVVDSYRSALETEKKHRLQRFEPSGVPIAPQQILQPEGKLAMALAVDSSGDFYVASGGGGEEVIRKYEPGNDAPIDVIAERGDVLAVDSAGHLFGGRISTEGSAQRRSIAEYDPSGTPLRRFGYGLLQTSFGGLAPYFSAGGDIYASETNGLNRVLHIDFPDPAPIVYPQPCKPSFLGNTKATLQAEVNPEGKATSFEFEYVDQKSFEGEGGWSSPEVKATPASDLVDAESEAIATDFVLHEASAQTGVLIPESAYRCRVVAGNADDPEVIGEEGAFTTLEPLQIGATWASGVTTESATLNAQINPLGIPTTAYFQYVDEATFGESGFAEAIKVPAGEPIEFGAGEAFEAGSAQITGLEPGAAYRYRIVATDVLISPKEMPGPTKRLRTNRVGESVLPDGRRYELVSPAQKNNAEVVSGSGISAAVGAITVTTYTAIQAGSTSGEAITYTSWTAFADPKSAPTTSQYLSKRTAGGWQTENLFPFGAIANGSALKPPFRGFDAGLAFGALAVGQPPLAGCPEADENLYLRDSETGAFACLTPEAPDLSGVIGEFCLDYAGASADGKRAFFAAKASYPGTGAPKGNGYSLYEWSAADGLRAVSVLPGKSTPAFPTETTAFGAAGNHCSTAEKVIRHVISADGSKAFWTYVAPGGTSSQLFARVGGEETIQLDKKVSGTGSSGEGVFLAASKDGSKVLFTSKNKLITGAGEDDLYLYDFDAEAKLKDLTPGGAGVKGLVGTSDDLSHAYFVASAVLTGEEENSAGQKAEAGKNNLYLYREGGLDFVAVLGAGLPDPNVWAPQPENLRARVSPDGDHLAFLSIEAEELAGYDNTLAEGAHCRLPDHKGEPLQGSPLCPQAFLYDADTGELTCASCNPSGARPSGPSELPGWSSSFEGPRYLSDDGERLFFESVDAIAPADENEKRDVYEFEFEGKGSCSEESPSFDLSSGGCHYLISSGRSGDESYLIDASSTGRDVFFSTRDPLVGWDANGNYDVYDAREGGGFAEPPVKPVCEGSACRPSLPPPPGSPPSLGTATFQGPGSAKKPPARCRKGKVRRRGRCIKPHKSRHKASNRKGNRPRARSNGGAAR